MRVHLYIVVIAIFLAIATFYRMFWNLGAPSLERWDEETNRQVISETISLQTFPFLFLNNKPFFEKPPFWYIVQIGITSLVGVNSFSLRFVSALSGLLIVSLVVFFSWRQWGPGAGIMSWVVLLTSHQLYIPNIQGYFATHTLRSADTDALHILLLLLSFFSSINFKSSVRSQYAMGVFSGLSMLTKSPLGFLPLCISTLLYYKQKQCHRALFRAWIAAISVTSPWYCGMILLFGQDFLSSHIGYHIQTRALFPIEGHYNSWGYFFFLLGNPHVYPWALVLIFSLFWIFIHPKLWRDNTLTSLTFIVVLLFAIPTLIQTRLSWYILPIYPFAALLIGFVTNEVLKKVKALFHQ